MDEVNHAESGEFDGDQWVTLTRLRGALDGMTAGCQLLDGDFRYLYVNDAVARQGRTSPDAMVGRTMQEIHPGIEDTELFRTLRDCLTTKAPRRFEHELVYPDGSSAWFELSVQPRPEGLFIVSTELTDRKREAAATQQDADSVRDAELLARTARDEREAIIRTSPAPIAAVDADGNVLIWNGAAERLFGWKASEVLRSKPPIVPPDKQQEFESICESVAHGVSLRHFVTIRVARSGRRIPVSISTSPLCDAGGSAAGMVAVITDLTEQNALRAALAESEQRFAAAFEASPTPKLLLRAADRRVVEANDAYLELSASRREDVLGQPSERLSVFPFHDTDFPSRLPDRGDSTDVEFDYRNARSQDGVAIARVVRLPIGGEDFVLAVFHDVTEQRRAERALRRSDERFRQLADTIQEVFWLTDAAKGQMIYVSPAYEAIWGRTCASLYETPQDWVDAIHPEDRKRVLAAALTQQSAGTYDEEYRVIRPDGSIRWIRDRGFPVKDPSGQPSTLVAGSAQDITERRQLEAQLRQTQKLESIGLLAGGIAHDFNNLLTVISSSCYSLKEFTSCGAECAEVVDEIRQASERATALTRQLLAFSRREVVAPRNLELTAVVADTERMLRRVLGEDILLTLSLGRSSSMVNVDPGSWVQVLMNLAVNARDAMPRGGELMIATGYTVIDPGCVGARSHLKPGPYVTLSVTDTGTGMSPDVQARIFEPFFTTKAPGHGTGLGLSVVHGIVAQRGGHIEVSSAAGEGTTFRMYVPAVETSAFVDERSDAAHLDRGGTETVLLVEDEEPIRRVSARALEKLGYTVLSCPDGVAALERATDYGGRIDLLITDVVMPRMDGHSLALALAKQRPGLRILFTSGYTDDAVVRYGVQHSEVDFLPKPYDPKALRRKVRETLDAHGASTDRHRARGQPPEKRQSAYP